jgi:urea transport system ATP-binding protein
MRDLDLPEAERAHPEKAFLVYLKDVVVSLEGFRLSVRSFGVKRNSLEVIIGGNGAGKTTIFDIISGKTRVTSGHVYFDGVDITRATDSAIAVRGVGRKFQTPTVFDSLTVGQNMELALPRRTKVLQTLFHRTTAAERARVREVLAAMDLLHEEHLPARMLSHGKRQWLELAMLTLADPALLLVDEPAAGLTQDEVHRTAERLKSLRDQHAIIVIEHNMEFVQELDAPITFLHKGNDLMYGSYDEIWSHPTFQDAYWGAVATSHT